MKRWYVVRLSALLVLAVCILGCALRPPISFVKSFDDDTAWRKIELRENLDIEQAWPSLIDTIAKKYDIEIADKDARYLRTAWKYTYVWRNRISDRYRSRIIVKFMGTDRQDLMVKVESNFLSNAGWTPGYDTLILNDVYGDVQGTVGRVRK